MMSDDTTATATLCIVADPPADDGDDADARGGGLREPRQPLPQPHARLRRPADGPLLHLADRTLGE